MANTKRLRKLRQRLWEKNPCCYWCGVKTVWWVEALGHAEKPKNAATLDHLISRLNPQRYQMAEYPSELMVIACDKCNNERGKREDISLRRITEWNSRKELKEVLTDPNLVVHYLYE